MYHLEEELDAVLAFQALVGQRRHGHFDHDSHRSTGADGARKALGKKALVEAPADSSGVNAIIKFKREGNSAIVVME